MLHIIEAILDFYQIYVFEYVACSEDLFYIYLVLRDGEHL